MPAANAGFLEFEQAYKLTHHGRTTARAAAEALLALERITLRTPTAINNMAGHTAILGIDVFVKKLEEGSWLSDLCFRVFFGTPEREAEFCHWLREKTGIEKNNVRTLFAITGTAVLAAGATFAVTRYSTGPNASEKANTVLAWNNTIIQIGAGELKMSPKEFAAIVERAAGRKATNAKDAARLLKSAKDGDEAAMMEIVGHDILNVPPAVVEAMPTPEQIEEAPSDNEVLHTKADVYLRATDLDSNSRGWAALVPVVADRRLKLELGPGIQPDLLYGQKKLTADVVAVMRAQRGGVSVPVRYRIVKIYAEGE